MVPKPAFQAGHVGSIPITRSFDKYASSEIYQQVQPLAVDRRGLFLLPLIEKRAGFSRGYNGQVMVRFPDDLQFALLVLPRQSVPLLYNR